MSYSFSALPTELVYHHIGDWLEMDDLEALSKVDKKTHQIIKEKLMNLTEDYYLVNSIKKLFTHVKNNYWEIIDIDEDQIAPRNCVKCGNSRYDQEKEWPFRYKPASGKSIYFCDRDAIIFSVSLQKLTEYEESHHIAAGTLYRRARESIDAYEKEELQLLLLEKQREEEAFQEWDG